jgi:hypothetical protein
VLLLTGKFIEHRGAGRKGLHNFVFGNLRELAGLGNNLSVCDQPVSGPGDYFLDNGIFVAEAAAE